ncbi:MAG: HAMP domain-containing sensor histidine kinase [Saprospiraceae bacterium]|nr:HAMP domain-containing sensor histidine kinase [Saprospiraceae bacterium]
MLSFKLPLRWITRFVIGYMVLAFLWWALQLWQENDRSFDLGVALLVRQEGVQDEQQLLGSKEYRQLLRRWEKKRRMVFAEGLFFTACLAFGLYVMNRSANREVALARQRRNFMLSITHELKSPIAAVRLALETMSRRELDYNRRQQLCENGLRDAARLQALVDDLLLAARLEVNWAPMHEPVDLQALAEEAIRLLKVRFPSANLELVVPAPLPAFAVDKAGITSVVHNLLENAIKYSPEGSPVRITLEQQGKKRRIVVADQGYGIPDAEKDAVFEKFYRIGNEETRKATGTGLGLYIVRQVVHGHGGRIILSDNHPKGTLFAVEFE